MRVQKLMTFVPVRISCGNKGHQILHSCRGGPGYEATCNVHVCQSCPKRKTVEQYCCMIHVRMLHMSYICTLCSICDTLLCIHGHLILLFAVCQYGSVVNLTCM